ncbi:MAG: hypothetical protein IKE20_04580 [Eggerthellaceae bacterium]|nr:hypothetical protein [Eggerthellaceae bacterium]
MTEIKSEPFVAARRASMMTQDEAATACGIKARQTFALREENPRDMTLGNLVDIYEQMSESGRKLLRDAVAALFIV